MAENQHYIAIGEEAARGVKESTTVGFVPILGQFVPDVEYDDQDIKAFDGRQGALGASDKRRMSQKWAASLEMALFTEAGVTGGMIGTLFKHFFGKVNSALGSGVGQYYHMYYPVQDPFSAANLGDKALTLNSNINEGAVMKNWPHVGARVKSLTFVSEPGQPTKLTVEFFGQFKDTTTVEIGSPTFPLENLRCDYNNLKSYYGGVTRVGVAPDYTDFTFVGATEFAHDKVTIKIENMFEDKLRNSGKNYPDKTNVKGAFAVTVDISTDWEDPSSDFSSVDEYIAYHNGISYQDLHFFWDTGTPADSGDNHAMHIDLPRMERVSVNPSYDIEADPTVEISYAGMYSAADLYKVGLMLKNTATAV